MKKIGLLCVSVLMGIGFYFFQLGANAFHHFGPPFEKSSLTPLKDIMVKPEMFADATIQVRGTITRQCPSSGCWFFIKDDGGTQIRVELGHMGITFPQMTGKQAIVEGKILPSGSDVELIGNNVEFH